MRPRDICKKCPTPVKLTDAECQYGKAVLKKDSNGCETYELVMFKYTHVSLIMCAPAVVAQKKMGQILNLPV